MSDQSARKELLSSPDSDLARTGEHDTWESAPWDGPSSEPASHALARRRDPGEALARAEAALVAARNEIALLRARVERLSEHNEQLEADLRALRSSRPR
jgi:hypothetical protein